MDNYNNIKQRVFVHVGTEKITMGCSQPSARKVILGCNMHTYILMAHMNERTHTV